MSGGQIEPQLDVDIHLGGQGVLNSKSFTNKSTVLYQNERRGDDPPPPAPSNPVWHVSCSASATTVLKKLSFETALHLRASS